MGKECAINACSFFELNALADDFKLNYKTFLSGNSGRIMREIKIDKIHIQGNRIKNN